MADSACSHDRCEENGHCILDALWLNPPEFANPEPISVAARLQVKFWEERRTWLAHEAEIVTTLWTLVEEGERVAA